MSGFQIRCRPSGAATLRAACVVAAAALVAAPGAAAHRRPRALPVTAGSRYLALGDSVTFGYEEAQVVPAPNYHDASSFLAYPEQVGSELHLKIANAACPGETSSSLIDASAQSNGCESGPTGNSSVSYRANFPLHVRYKGSQLAYALTFLRTHRDVRLVSLMIGANDLFVCQETTSDSCASSAEQSAVLAKIAHNVHKIVAAIRNKAHYHGQLAIVNYYSLNYASAAVNAIVGGLNKRVDGAARPFHVTVANGYGEFKAAALHFGGDPCGAGLLTQLGAPGKCGVHPSYAGQALLGQALEKAIRI